MRRFSIRTFAAIAGFAAVAAGCAEGSRSPTETADSGAIHLLRRPALAPGLHASESGAEGSASAVIGPDGGTLQLSNGYRIDFPQGALAAPTTITMTAAVNAYGVEMEPHGIQFPAGHEPVLTLSVDSAAAAGLSQVAVVYTDGSRVLEVLPTDWQPESTTLRASLKHFSGYMAGGS